MKREPVRELCISLNEDSLVDNKTCAYTRYHGTFTEWMYYMRRRCHCCTSIRDHRVVYQWFIDDHRRIAARCSGCQAEKVIERDCNGALARHFVIGGS